MSRKPSAPVITIEKKIKTQREIVIESIVSNLHVMDARGLNEILSMSSFNASRYPLEGNMARVISLRGECNESD